jgi:biotin-(acetyl-CoA carboxylase) ligase
MMFDLAEFEATLATEVVGREPHEHQVVLSVDVAALQLGREQEAPHGAMVVTDHEVAPKVRLGEAWTGGGHAAAFVLRPDLAAAAEGVLWMAASLAFADALDGQIRWPDTVLMSDESVGRVNVNTTLAGPVIKLAVVSVRISSARDWPQVVARTANALEAGLAAADLSGRVEARLLDMGARVRVGLMPRGETVGVVTGITPTGAISLEMGSGRIGDLPVGQARILEPVE